VGDGVGEEVKEIRLELDRHRTRQAAIDAVLTQELVRHGRVMEGLRKLRSGLEKEDRVIEIEIKASEERIGRLEELLNDGI
jgi:hypothetical protein